MSDLPPGEWSELLVGHQWPGVDSLATLTSAATSRGSISNEFSSYADTLQSIRNETLAHQEGITAEDARHAFQTGETSARAVSERNSAAQTSYDSAHRSTQYLRTQLSEIARDGNAAIEDIQRSKDPLPIKLGKIVDVVSDAQTQANIRAAACSDRLFADIQQILDSEDLGASARQFAKTNGVDVERAFSSPSESSIRDQVSTLIEKTGADSTSTDPSGGGAELMSGGNTTEADQASVSGKSGFVSGGNTSESTSSAGTAPVSTSNQATKLPSAATAGSNTTPTPGSRTEGSSHLAYSANVRGGTTPPGLDNTPPGVPQPGLPATVTGGGSNDMSGLGPSAGGSSLPSITPQSPSLPSATASTSTPANALTPDGFAQNFNAGSQAGNPMSAGTEALSNSAAHAMQPQTPLHPESMAAPPFASTTPSAGGPLFENAHAAPAFDPPAPAAPPADATPTYMAAPAAPAAPVMSSTAAPAVPQGPLPAYGADLRPPAATAPAAPPPGPLAASPASAPVHPSNASPLSQPAVVRQQPAPLATPAHTPAGIAENAVAATGTGAISGAAAAQTRAQQRLQRLVDAVARQEPKLSWAVGDRDDATTVLTTDLASGWIPPHVEIPTGITLLTPGRRNRTLEALLGETTLTAAYAPGQYIPPADDAEPVPTSIRARDTDDVDELGWELSQATKWRDGLPRLAHTLAKAVSTRTGYLDSEADLLREHLATVAARVIADYPDADVIDIGHWQLLATIDALIKDEKTAANYHFAWFQALSLVLKGDERR